MPAERTRRAPCRLARALTIVMIASTAAVSLLWSHAKLFSQDEMYEFQTDSVSSLRELIHVQRTWPISLDPLLSHMLSHGAMQVFGATAFAQRLPALLGFLLMQVCLFFVARRLAGERAGAVAATFPALTATLYYSAEGRPYGLLLGLYALALLCWIEASEARPSRFKALLGLAIAIAATLNTHYFGILVLLPICAAELWRTIERRQFDWPMLSAIGAGTAAVLFTRPFMKAAGEFKTHYYNEGSVGLHDITRAYRSLFVNYTTLPMTAQRLWAATLVVFAAALVWGCWLAWRRGFPRLSPAQWILFGTLAAMPFAGYLLARFVTHSIEVRYVLGTVVVISALLAIAVARWLESDRVFSVVMMVLGVVLVAGGAVRIRSERGHTRERLDTLVLPNAAIEFLRAHPDRRIYIQDMGAFEEDRYYEPDANVKARMTLVYSADEELRWNRHDTMALTAMHMQHFTSLPITDYEQVRTLRGEQLFVLRHTGWDWTDHAFEADGAQVRVIGHALDGDVTLVTFRQAVARLSTRITAFSRVGRLEGGQGGAVGY
jgi:hypothetical protein